MSDVVICEPLRTPVGRFGGVFRDIARRGARGHRDHRTGRPHRHLRRRRRRRDPRPGLPRAARPRRSAGSRPSMPGCGVDVPGLQVDRRCGSGLQAVIQAVMQVQTGGCDLVLAGGVESMSQAEFYATGMRCGVRGESLALNDRLARARVTAGGRNYPVPGGMIETAENLRARVLGSAARSRTSSPCSSHQRAVAAQRGGTLRRRRSSPSRCRSARATAVVDTDEHPRADTTLESLAQAAPDPRQGRPRVHRHRRQRQRPERRRRRLHRHHRRRRRDAPRPAPLGPAASAGPSPVCRRARWASARCRPPRRPSPRLGLTLADMDLIELNEAFAAQVLAVTREWGLEPDDSSGSTPTAPASRWATRSAPPAPASSRRCCARCSAARPATASRPCASAAARAWPRCSSASD